jgi:hypothetical protein
MQVFIQWDPLKGRKNLLKHGVAFDEAASVLFDPMRLERPDEKHSTDTEARFITIGLSTKKRVLMMVYTYRRSYHHEKEIYRIISSRIANQNEKKTYYSAQE